MANKKKIMFAALAVVLALVLVIVALPGGGGSNAPVSDPATGRFDAAEIRHEGTGVKLGAADEEGFTLVAENSSLRLFLNLDTLALRVEDVAGGNVYRSYADSDEGLNGKWQNFMYSGVTMEYMTPETKLVRVPFVDGGKAKVTTCDNGADVAVSFKEGFAFTLCLDITGGVLTVTVPESSIVEPEDGSMVLENLYLYPFLGATHGMDVPGYLFVPDGCGALVRMSNQIGRAHV